MAEDGGEVHGRSIMSLPLSTTCVSIMSTIPGLNGTKLLNVFRYLACLQFIAYLPAFVLELMFCFRQFDMGLNFVLYRALKIVT